MFLETMSIYDLRSLFPLSGFEFPSPDGNWICRLAEASDLRPEVDRLSWYLVFEPASGKAGSHSPELRKLEIVTSAEHLLGQGFGPELKERIESWLASGEQDGREEWLDF